MDFPLYLISIVSRLNLLPLQSSHSMWTSGRKKESSRHYPTVEWQQHRVDNVQHAVARVYVLTHDVGGRSHPDNLVFFRHVQQGHLSLQRVLEEPVARLEGLQLIDGVHLVGNGVVRDDIRLPLGVAEEFLQPGFGVVEPGPGGEAVYGLVGGCEEGVGLVVGVERVADHRKVGDGTRELGEVGVRVDDLEDGHAVLWDVAVLDDLVSGLEEASPAHAWAIPIHTGAAAGVSAATARFLIPSRSPAMG